MTIQINHPRFVSVDQLTCPSWCSSNHTADLGTTTFLCDVLHTGRRLEAVPFGAAGEVVSGALLAAVELEATTDDDGQAGEPQVYFMPNGTATEGWDLSLPELRAAAEVMRQQADRLNAYADDVADVLQADATGPDDGRA